MNNVTFDGIECTVEKGRYLEGGSISISLYSKHEGPMARLTVNLPGLKADEIALDYNNLRRWWDEVVVIVRELGYVDTNRSYKSGFCEYPVWRLEFEQMELAL